MENVKKSPFKLTQFIISDFSIKREPVKKGKIAIKIKPSGVINRNDNSYLLHLDVDVKDDTGSFAILMSTIGYFSFKNTGSVETLSNYFYTNAPAIIFPYIRSYITAITSLTGIDAVYLPTLSMGGLKDELKANTSEVSD